MANVIKTVLTYPLNGNTTDFNIPFEYLARKFVVVTLIGVDRRVLTLTTDYRFATRTTISTTKAWGPADGYTQVEIRRVTSATERLIDFTDGSILRAYDLNIAQIQTMHVAEEARDMTADTIGVNNDGHLDARGRRIVNVANAVDDRDVVPLGQLKVMNQNSWQARNEALQFRNEAEQFKNEAQTHRTDARVFRNEAEQFRNEAASSATSAEQSKSSASSSASAAANSASSASRSEQAAGNYSVAAGNSAVLAGHHADRAKAEADKLEHMNDFAGAILSVTPTTVSFNREVTTRNAGFRSMTDPDRIPNVGVWRQGKSELNMTVDESGNTGFVGAVGTPWLGYWNPGKDTYVSSVQYNLDAGHRQIQGNLTVGHGTNSSVLSQSWGESTVGNWASQIYLKWYAGGVQVGPVRGSGIDCQGLYRTVSAAHNTQLDYWQDPASSQHRFYNTSGQQVFNIHSNGDVEMQWGGLLSTQIRNRVPRRWTWTHIGNMPISDNAVLNLPFDVRGLRCFFAFPHWGNTIYKEFAFPPLDGYFQVNRGGNWQVFQLANNGTQLIRRYGWDEGSDPYVFYVENPNA